MKSSIYREQQAAQKIEAKKAAGARPRPCSRRSALLMLRSSCRREILFAMKRYGADGAVPCWITSVNKRGTPTAAPLPGTAIAVALVLSGSFET